MLSKKVLTINELKPGMISSADIHFEGKTLLAKDSIITESIISILNNNYIVDKLEVYQENNSNKILALKIKPEKEIENTFTEFSSNLKNVFNNISMLQVPQLDQIRTFSHKIQQEFNSTGVVLKSIVLYGNENDSIYRHSVNVAAVSFILGKWLGLDNTEINLLSYSAILHDFGKTKLSKTILTKLNNKDNLTPEEYEIYKTHPILGYNLIKQVPYISTSIISAILFHHERLDGSGYPLHIKENEIPRFAKIIAIADLFDEVNSKKDIGPLNVLKVIQDESATGLDLKYCNMFLNHITNYYIGENVILNDKRSCKIVKIEMDDLTRPILLADNGLLDLKKEKGLYVEKLIL